MKNKKYVTVQEGVDFRTIAKIMTNRGYKMNHATARNVLISAIKKLLTFSADKMGTKISDRELNILIKEQNLHAALADVLFLANKKNKGKKNVEQK